MNKNKNIVTILYVEDEDGVRKGFAKALGRYAKTLYEASNGEEGLALYKEVRPDIVVSDIKMPKMNGIEMSKAIKEINPQQAIIVTTAHSESEYLLEAIKLQLSGYILKPVNKKILQNKILEISENIQIKKEAQQYKDLMHEVANYQNNMLMVYDKDYNIIFLNKLYLDFFAVDTIDDFDEKYGCICNTLVKQDDFFSFEPEKDGHWTQEIEKLSADKQIIFLSDNRDMMGKAFIVNCHFIKETQHKICTFSEITKINSIKKEYEQKAYIDELTKIYNRAKFNQTLTNSVIDFDVNRKNISLIIFDIDHFKIFNDTYGHQLGDDILRSLAKIIKEYTRESDLFARWGGEEFVILLVNANLDIGLKIAEEKRRLIEEHIFTDNLKVTCSFGVSSMQEGDTQETLLKRADDALYEAKKSGRNCVRG